MASLSLYLQFESNLMSNRKVIDFLLQLKSAKAHGKNYIKVRPPLVRHFSVIVYSINICHIVAEPDSGYTCDVLVLQSLQRQKEVPCGLCE